VQLDVAQGAFFTWSPATGLSNSGIPNPVATPATTTEYIVVGIDPGGCHARDTVLITVKPSPVVNVTSDTVICKGATVQLSATGGGTYQWNPAADLNNTSISNPVSSATADITYKVKVTGTNACITEDSVKVAVRPYPLLPLPQQQLFVQAIQLPFQHLEDIYICGPHRLHFQIQHCLQFHLFQLQVKPTL
jgi:hypothetical protein